MEHKETRRKIAESDSEAKLPDKEKYRAMVVENFLKELAP